MQSCKFFKSLLNLASLCEKPSIGLGFSMIGSGITFIFAAQLQSTSVSAYRDAVSNACTGGVGQMLDTFNKDCLSSSKPECSESMVREKNSLTDFSSPPNYLPAYMTIAGLLLLAMGAGVVILALLGCANTAVDKCLKSSNEDNNSGSTSKYQTINN